MPRVGIDLGTTNTVVCVDGRAASLEVRGGPILPSAVAFLPNGTRSVGAAARRRRSIDSPNTIFSSKRIIGRQFDDSRTRDFTERYPFEISANREGMPVFRTRAGDFTPTEIASFILTEVVERTGIEPSECETVITVPASFNPAQRRATREAATALGFRQPNLLAEASATAIAYLQAEHHVENDIHRAVVYDLGGGTFDCAVIDCSSDAPEILSHTSDLQLGGDDIDHTLALWVVQHVLEKHNWDLRSYSETFDRLLAHCEAAKIGLADQSEVAIQLSQVDPECPVDDGDVMLSRSKLAEVCQGLVQRSFIACDEVLRAAGVGAPEIDAVFLAGGTTLLPMVQQNVEAYFGNPGWIEFDPREVVAVGAGIACADGGFAQALEDAAESSRSGP